MEHKRQRKDARGQSVVLPSLPTDRRRTGNGPTHTHIGVPGAMRLRRVAKSDKGSLDIVWLRDESLQDSENLPSSDVTALIEDRSSSPPSRLICVRPSIHSSAPTCSRLCSTPPCTGGWWKSLGHFSGSLLEWSWTFGTWLEERLDRRESVRRADRRYSLEGENVMEGGLGSMLLVDGRELGFFALGRHARAGDGGSLPVSRDSDAALAHGFPSFMLLISTFRSSTSLPKPCRRRASP